MYVRHEYRYVYITVQYLYQQWATKVSMSCTDWWVWHIEATHPTDPDCIWHAKWESFASTSSPYSAIASISHRWDRRPACRWSPSSGVLTLSSDLPERFRHDAGFPLRPISKHCKYTVDIKQLGLMSYLINDIIE